VIVEQLWRYPVKSLGGEAVETIHVGQFGLDGDRAYGLLDVETGYILTARREPALLFGSARLSGAGEVVVTMPDGTVARDDRVLSAWLGREVRLVRAGDAGGHFESVTDFENESSSQWVDWHGPPAAFHDSGSARVSLVSRESIGDWDPRRFRANVLLTGGGEDDLVGRAIEIGSCRLTVEKRLGRCVMVTRPQPGVDRDLDVLRTINQSRAARLAIGALVVRPGAISVGDELVGLAAGTR
jgi:uncharacterized protein YcbX